MSRWRLVLLSGRVSAWPFAARVQHFGRTPTIGYVGGTFPAAESEWLAASAVIVVIHEEFEEQ